MHVNGKKGQLEKFISSNFVVEEKVNPSRIYEVNNNDISDEYVYLTSRDLRVEDNFALNFTKDNAKNFKVVHIKNNFENEGKNNFYLENLELLKKNYENQNIYFEIIEKNLKDFLKELENKTLVIDFNPLTDNDLFNDFKGKIFEVDSHNIVPARIASDKQEYSAFTLRKKIYEKIYEYLTEFPKYEFDKNRGYEI